MTLITHVPLPAFAAVAGSRAPKILFVGEAWGESEALTRQPLVGESGKELWRMLGEAWPGVAPAEHAEAAAMHNYGAAWVKPRTAWMEAAAIAYTNTLALRPPGNKLEMLCLKKKEVEELAAEMGARYDWPSIKQGQYLRPEYLAELLRLDEEIDVLRPNLIVALGNVACWALLRETNIGSIRGTIRVSRPIAGRAYKVLPTYHPAAIMRQWGWRPQVVGDLMKALREGQSPEIVRPKRSILVKPTLDEVWDWVRMLLATPRREVPYIACDTETRAGQVTMIGFARSRSDAILIPFSNERPALMQGPAGPIADPRGWNYWAEPWQEESAREAVDQLLRSDIPKIFQNGMYDFQYLIREKFNLHACIEDTMLLHHSILPEMRKGLGFLGAAYTNEPAWKLDRLAKADTEKRDE